MTAIAIFVGAGLGGLARHGVSGWLQSTGGAGFPWGTLLVNVSGSLLLALLYTLLDAAAAAPEWRAFLGVGLLGGYTTFSAFSHETIRMVQDGQWERALVYVAGSVVLSVAGAALGFGLAEALLRRG